MKTYDCQGRQVSTPALIPWCVILNSRQSKRPCKRDNWVQSTRDAVAFAKSKGYGLITSIGLNTWELTVHLAHTVGMDQAVVIPSPEEDTIARVISEILRDFQLDATECRFLVADPQPRSSSRAKESWPERDLMAIELADLILPVSIRPRGNLECLLTDAISLARQTRNDFRVPYLKPVDRIHYDFLRQRLNPAIASLDHSYVIHWTRSSHSPYPGETRHNYYRDILSSETYPRSAFHTLSRIITEGVIRGSARFIRGGQPAVSLSSLAPNEAVALMRWRRRYVYYNFEPYGVAIGRDAAEAAGIRPVVYGDAVQYGALDDGDRPFFQHQGSEHADWRPENEWRHLGDLDLRRLPLEEVCFITHTESEASALRSLTKSQVLSLTIS